MSYDRLRDTEDPPLWCQRLNSGPPICQASVLPPSKIPGLKHIFNLLPTLLFNQLNETMVQIFIHILRIKKLGFIIVKKPQEK